LIGGFGAYREAAVDAITSLGHEPVTAETFSPGVSSPRVACLAGVRASDMVILMLGERYGDIQQPSGLSATHEEYRAARDTRPVIAFVQEGVEYEPGQAEFVSEVQDWAGGLFRGGFKIPSDLRSAITKAIHQYELSAAAAPVNTGDMLARAAEIIPEENRQVMDAGGPLLHLAVVGGPAQTILRPVQIEDSVLARELKKEALFGDNPIFDSAMGTDTDLANGRLTLCQQSGATLQIDEAGAIRVSMTIQRGEGMMGALIAENVLEAVRTALAHAANVLDRIDDTQKLSRIVIAASLGPTGVFGWRTRAEEAASPNSMTMAHSFSEANRGPVHFQPADRARAALSFDREHIAEDLVALLRRQFHG
jgi:hypothetical protein